MTSREMSSEEGFPVFSVVFLNINNRFAKRMYTISICKNDFSMC